jgi:hypothetical protein
MSEPEISYVNNISRIYKSYFHTKFHTFCYNATWHTVIRPNIKGIFHIFFTRSLMSMWMLMVMGKTCSKYVLEVSVTHWVLMAFRSKYTFYCGWLPSAWACCCTSFKKMMPVYFTQTTFLHDVHMLQILFSLQFSRICHLWCLCKVPPNKTLTTFLSTHLEVPLQATRWIFSG